MPRRPVKLTADGHVVTIEWDSAKLGRLSQGYGVKGDHTKGRIRIGSGLPSQVERVTFLHELMHEAVDLAQLTHLNAKDEEYVLNGIDDWLFLLLDENPAIRRYLWG